MKALAAVMLFVLAAPAFAQAPDLGAQTGAGAGNSSQCWDNQKLVVRERETQSARQKNDTSAVAGHKHQSVATTGSTSTNPPDPTPEQAANAKRPPGVADC